MKDKWRVPTIDELTSIIDYTKFRPATELPKMQPSSYWSSTTYAGDPDDAWGVYFDDGVVGSGDKGNYGFYVRCVRGGQSGELSNFDGKRFLKKKDCYLDKKTGLEWALENTGKMTWNDAMAVSDWEVENDTSM